MKKVVRGEQLEIAAEEFNSFIDAAEFVKKQRQNVLTKTNKPDARTIVQVVLDQEYGAYEVIGLGDSSISPLEDEEVYLPQFLQTIVFEGALIDIDLHKEKYGILIDAGLEDEVVGCVTDGIIQTQVKITNYNHEWAVIDDMEVNLTSSFGGTTRILYKPDDTEYTEGDTVWCIVKVGVNPQFPPVYQATSNASGGEITGKRIDSDGIMVGEEETFLVLPEGS